ncbi:hypothetical protein OsI_02336 [Oryza sativa Indica Group]|uniref:DNA helicase n=1 Tax=Oryza sativa subsp. indica TaxID=39946 RepID=B8A9Q9_ORYSI|nr:hypothetical protein OsI_02336 [Oryza sativa Indica Group]
MDPTAQSLAGAEDSELARWLRGPAVAMGKRLSFMNAYLTEDCNPVRCWVITAAVAFLTLIARQIESLIRLSEALARMRFSEMVEVQDVVEAFRLLEVAMQQSATDHATGTIDMDLIMTGISASERQRRDNLVAATRNLVMEKMQLGGPSVRMIELLEEIRKQSSMEVHLHDLRGALGTLMTEGAVVIHGDSVKRV